MKRAKRIVALGTFGALLVVQSGSFGAPDKGKSAAPDTPLAAGETSQVKPASERALDAPPMKKQLPKSASADTTGAATPATRGPRLPEDLRIQLKAQLDARIDTDLDQIKALRQEAIKLLTTFIAESPKETTDLPEALVRLGELKWEVEREGFVDRFKDWEKKPVDQRGPAPELNYAPSRELFARVLKDYPNFGEYDLALYVDGFLATEQGKVEEAFDHFTRILKEYPNSRFIADAHMARAETMFNKPDYPTALAEYEQVLKFPKSDLIGLALFKSAWCHWRLGNSEEATKRFVRVFEVTDTSNKANVNVAQQKALDELQGEALKYLVEVFTEDDKNTAQDMYGFLTKIGGDRFAGKIVRALADTYYDQAHFDRGIEAYELLLKLEPTSRDAGGWVLRIAEGYNQVEDYPKMRATYDRALVGYTKDGPWARTQADPANVADTSAKIEAQLREHAIGLHGKAQRDKTSRAEYEGAAALYEAYLTKFGKEPKAYDIEFKVAEIDFYHLGKNTEAASHYMNAARLVPNEEAQKEPLKTLRHDAIYNAIAALERVRVAELEARKGKPGGQETETDKKFAEALDLYAQLYPEDPALPELFFRQGKLYYDYGVYDPAVKLWGALLEKFPKSQYAQGAGELILDSFNKSKNFDNIETWARRLKTAPSFQDPKLQAKLDVLLIQAVFKQGEQKSQAGDHAGAALAYLRAAKEFPKDARAAQAGVNAETEAKLAGDVTTLKEAASLITGKDYADKPESPQGAWIAATTLQAMGLFSDAAEYDEAIANLANPQHPNYAKFEHAKDAAYNAVVLRVATGDHDKAIADGNKFLTGWGSAAEVDDVVFEMGRAHQNAGRAKDAIDLYKRYLAKGTRNQNRRMQGFVLLAKAQLKNSDEKGADESLTNAVRSAKQLGRSLGPDGKYAAAQARYMQGERVLARFEAVKVEGDIKQLAKRLKEKVDLLKAAAGVFLDVVPFGVAEWTTAALYKVGYTYETFAKSLRDSPPPPEVKTDADKDEYSSQIETFAVPVEEKSLDAYENGWKKAIELGIYNQWTAKMRDALGRLNAELYPAFKETGFEIRSEGPNALPALLEAPRRGPQAEVVAPTVVPAPTVIDPKAKKK